MPQIFGYLVECQAPLARARLVAGLKNAKPTDESYTQDCRRATTHPLKDSNNTTTAIMAALNKIAPTSPSRQHPSELETSIANALYDLESNIPDMKSALRPLQFVSAREVRGSHCHSRHTPFNQMKLDIYHLINSGWSFTTHIPYAQLPLS